MSDETGRRLLTVTFIAAVAMITYLEIHDKQEMPKPARYVGAGVVYGILGIVAPFITYPLAGMFGVGVFLALLYQHYKPNAGAEKPATPQPR